MRSVSQATPSTSWGRERIVLKGSKGKEEITAVFGSGVAKLRFAILHFKCKIASLKSIVSLLLNHSSNHRHQSN